MSDNVWVALRAALMIGGTMLATMGYMKHEDLGEFARLIDIAFPAIIALGGFMWGQYVRWRTMAVPIKTAMRSDVPTVSAATGQVTPGPDLSEKATGV